MPCRLELGGESIKPVLAHVPNVKKEDENASVMNAILLA